MGRRERVIKNVALGVAALLAVVVVVGVRAGPRLR